ncbi:uncharacterized protein BDR25DRAFT_298608 [Lindgomyces ingoldianus]|uniref:Uncharacterized protein n=1 Tax=Lindgomyces ingoldianus TaxID=673940 RepID=A0ACB6Q958_9PLEO|nr:uncharacterized protein BDR25DRAFT_298608 [Lindgomyces ingoldianus]KAF2463075.1 hypothetical protein BDR25DRAFT_298608 [Lindgomyces ingoldianus]
MATSTIAVPKPAMTPPPGQEYDPTDPPNALWRFNVAAQAVCMTVATILFFMRCFIRLGLSRMPRQWILEDWMVTLSFIGLACYSALITYIMDSDGGVHQWNLLKPTITKILYYFYIESIIYGPIIFCTKLAILLMYLRLLIPSRWSPLWTSVHVFIAICAAFYTGLTLVKIFQCNPIPRTWDKSIHGKCINTPVLLQVSGLFNTITDALILLVPVRAVWDLKMTWKKKVAVCAVFGIGCIAPVFSAIGFTYRVRAAKSADLTYNNPLMLLWATAEITTGIICACLPTLPTLFRRRRQNTTLTSSHSQSTPHSVTRSYQRNKTFEYGEYLELDETPGSSSPNREEVVTTVKGGASPAASLNMNDGWGTASSERLTEEEERRNGAHGNSRGIVRTVRIEQTGSV